MLTITEASLSRGHRLALSVEHMLRLPHASALPFLSLTLPVF
jgi:hypothetical protein